METYITPEHLQAMYNNYKLEAIADYSYKIQKKLESQIIYKLNKLGAEINTQHEFAQFVKQNMRAYPIPGGYRFFVNNKPFMETLTQSYFDLPNGKAKIEQQFIFL
jgi:hypothetical protein